MKKGIGDKMIKNLIAFVTEEEVKQVAQLTDAEKNSLIERINCTDPFRLFDRNPHNEREIICPFCQNGGGKDHTGVKPTFENNRWLYNCFRGNCDFKGDLIKIIATANNLDSKGKEFFKVLAIGAKIINCDLNFTTDFNRVNQKSSLAPARKVEEQKEYERLEESRNNLATLFKERENWRGLTFDVLKRLGWGYLENFSNEKTEWLKFPAIIIPNVKGGIFAREIEGKEKSNISPTAPTIINLPNEIKYPITIVEGAIDGASLAYSTEFKYPVISTGGTNGTEKALEFLLSKYPTEKPPIVVMFDNDSNGAGKKAAEPFVQNLIAKGFPAVMKFIVEKQDFDSNSILLSEGKDALRNNFEKVMEIAQIELPVVAKEIEENKKLRENIKAWQELNGSIAPETLQKLETIAGNLKTVTSENITAEMIQSSTSLYEVAQCRYYDFYSAPADNFIRAAKQAQKKFPSVSIKEMNENISRFITAVKKDHKTYLRKLKQEEAKVEYDKRNEEYKENRDRAFQEVENLKAELKKLQTAPISQENKNRIDKLIIEVITLIREKLLQWNYTKNGRRDKVKSTVANCDIIFNNDPNLENLFGYDEFKNCDAILKKAVWHKDNSCVGEQWQDSDDSELRNYLRQNYCELSGKDLIADSFAHYSHKRSFHPIKQYFDNLPQWDGKPRAADFFINWLKVDDNEYSREVTIKWLLGAMARIYNPGCTFQAAIVLQGAQFIGKSFTLEMLGGKWYAVLNDNLDDPHAIDAIQGVGIVEIKEFSAAKKAEINATKSFIERGSDNRRAAYAKRATDTKRQCVFAITTNEQDFLKDRTGNRRFWILKCNAKKFHYEKEVDGEQLNDEYIAQIWAEVKVKYAEQFKSKFDAQKLQLSYDNQIRAEQIAAGFLQDDDIEGAIKSFLAKKIPPQEIWLVMTQEERKKFFVEGITDICKITLISRIGTKKWAEIEEVLRNRYDRASYEKDRIRLTGRVNREHICAAEVQNECFANSMSRPSAKRINDILQSLDGFQLGKQFKRDSEYGEMKKVFWRKEEVSEEPPPKNSFESNKQQLENAVSGSEEVDDDDFPF